MVENIKEYSIAKLQMQMGQFLKREKWNFEVSYLVSWDLYFTVWVLKFCGYTYSHNWLL